MVKIFKNAGEGENISNIVALTSFSSNVQLVGLVDAKFIAKILYNN